MSDFIGAFETGAWHSCDSKNAKRTWEDHRLHEARKSTCESSFIDSITVSIGETLIFNGCPKKSESEDDFSQLWRDHDRRQAVKVK